jgi:hypothetical protein
MVALPKHGKFKNLTGLRFGKLLVVSYAGKVKRYCAWNCVCDCGNKTVVLITNIRRAKSCGCLEKIAGEINFKHGHAYPEKTRTYNIWRSMKQRCSNPKNKAYKYYGGRGIKVCDRWLHSFEKFLEDMGEVTPGLSIDRRNNNGNYEPRNCRWADASTQMKNRRKWRHA